VDRLADRFLAPPLCATGYEQGFGTLYTAVYRPVEQVVEYRWPGSARRHSADAFHSGRHTVHLGGHSPM
jgi:hypothetical protein